MKRFSLLAIVVAMVVCATSYGQCHTTNANAFRGSYGSGFTFSAGTTGGCCPCPAPAPAFAFAPPTAQLPAAPTYTAPPPAPVFSAPLPIYQAPVFAIPTYATFNAGVYHGNNGGFRTGFHNGNNGFRNANGNGFRANNGNGGGGGRNIQLGLFNSSSGSGNGGRNFQIGLINRNR